MSTTTTRLLGGLCGLAAAGGLSLALAVPAGAQTPCPVEPYSEATPPECGGGTGGGTGGSGGGAGGSGGDTTTTGGGGGTGGDATGSRGELPFTGGEVLVLSLVGASALVGGTVLVVAARRRTTPAAAA